MSTALVAPGPQELATILNEGMEGFDDAPLKPAEYELVQKTSHVDGALPGHFRNRLTGDQYPSIRVVPIKYYNGRVLFPPGDFSADAKPLCKSIDGKVPAPFPNITPQSPLCSTCDFGKKMWETKGKPPSCKETMRWLFVDHEQGVPFWLSLKSTSISPTNKIIATLRQYATISKNKGEPRSLFDYVFTLKTRLMNTPKGSFYVVEYADVAKLAEIGKYSSLYRALTSRRPEDETTEDAAIDNAVEEQVAEI